MSDALPNIIAQMRRLYQHMQSGGHITGPDLGREIEKLEVLQTSVDGARAAIQAHHDLKHGRAGGRSAAVLSPVDRALYEATGIKHAVLGFDEGSLDDVRRAPAREVSDVGFVEQMLAFEAVMAADSETLRALEDGDV